MAVKRLLRKYSYTPDKQEKGVKAILEQAEDILEQIAQAAQVLRNYMPVVFQNAEFESYPRTIHLSRFDR